MDKHLRLIGERSPTGSFGCAAQGDEAFRRMKRHIVPVPREARTDYDRRFNVCRGVEVKYLAPVLGVASWLVRERRDYDLFQIDDGGWLKIIYEEDDN